MLLFTFLLILFIEFYTSKAFLRAWLNCKNISYSNIIFKVSIDLYTSVNYFTNDFYILAISFRSPGIWSRIWYITLSHKIIKLIWVIWKNIITAYKSRYIWIYKFTILVSSNNSLYSRHFLTSYLSCWVEPSWRSCTRSYQ